MRLTRQRRLLKLLGILSLILATQHAYLRFTAILHAQEEVQQQYDQASASVARMSQRIRTLRIRCGDLWAGSLHADQSIVTQRPPEGTPNMMAARRINGDVPMGSGVKGMLELHECHPGSDFCTSGGMLQLVGEDDKPILTATLSLFQEGSRSSYEFSWNVADNELNDEVKFAKLQEIVGTIEPSDRDNLYRLVRTLYGYDSAASGTRQQLQTELIKSILSKALHDRQSL